MDPTLIDKENIQLLLAKYDTFLFDLDGVIWFGGRLIPNVRESLKFLRANGKNVFFLTNNSRIQRTDYVKKLSGFGIQCSLEEIVNSASATADYLSRMNFKGKVFLCAEKGMHDELKNVGIESFGHEEEFFSKKVPWDKPLEVDNDVKAVVVGYDINFNLYKVAYAFECIVRRNCLFIATNTDRLCPHYSELLPGGGTMVSAIQAETLKQPVICGKPSTFMWETIHKKHNLDPSRTLMIGDNISTDITFGKNCGLMTLLVLSGYSTLKDARENNIVPDYYSNSVGHWVSSQ